MSKILSLDWPGLNQFTKTVYSDIKNQSQKYGKIDRRSDPISATTHYVVHLTPDVVEYVNREFPFIEPTLVLLEQQPGYMTPHIDGTIEWGYPYNLVVPVTDENESTIVYYENEDLMYNEAWKTTGSKYFRDLDKLKPIFEFNFVQPIVFFNQQLHSMVNKSDKTVVVGTWKLHKDLNTDSIVEWANKRGIDTKEIF